MKGPWTEEKAIPAGDVVVSRAFEIHGQEVFTDFGVMAGPPVPCVPVTP